MKIEYLKLRLQDTGTSDVRQVFFDAKHIVNTEREKDYPYVLWDLNTFRSRMNWQSVSQQKEEVTMKAYCIGYLDKEVQGGDTYTLEETYDMIREAFRGYLTHLLEDQYISITNLADMPNELFSFGITVDAEVGVSFDVNFDLYCNAEVGD